MNGIEFQCFREELGLSIQEVSAFTDREESELKLAETSIITLKDDLLSDLDGINETIDNLIEDSISELETSISNGNPKEISLVVYPDSKSFKKYNPEIFELIPSACAHRLALWQVKLEVEENTGVQISMVRFQEDEYKAWLEHNKLKHTLPQVSKWAAQVG